MLSTKQCKPKQAKWRINYIIFTGEDGQHYIKLISPGAKENVYIISEIFNKELEEEENQVNRQLISKESDFEKEFAFSMDQYIEQIDHQFKQQIDQQQEQHIEQQDQYQEQQTTSLPES